MDSTIKICTRFEPHETQYQWSIENWSEIHHQVGIIRSETFELSELHVKLYFELNIYGEQTLELKVFIEHPKPNLYPQISAYFCRASDEKIMMTASRQPRKDGEFINYGFWLPDVLRDLKPTENAITIRCGVKYYVYETISQELSQLKKELAEAAEEASISLSRSKEMLNNFAQLFKKEQICDIMFVFQEKRIKAHKIVLAMESPYFYQKFMFEAESDNMSEINYSNDSQISYQIFQELLEYIYGIKTIQDLKHSVTKLYILAERFDMEKLKKSCETFIMDMEH